MSRATMLGLSAWLGVGLLGAVPRALLAGAEEDYQLLFGAEEKKVAATKTTLDDAQFARKLLQAGQSLGDSPQVQALVCGKAFEFAVKHRGTYDVAREAVAVLEKSQPGEPAKWRGLKQRILELQYVNGYGPAKQSAGREYLDLLLALAAENIQAGEPDQADALLQKAFPVATFLKSPQASEILQQRRDLIGRRTQAKRIQALLKDLEGRLKRNPDDTEARRQLILLHLVELRQPAKAVALLTDKLDLEFHAFAELAAGPADDLSEADCLRLAVWFRGLGDKAQGQTKACLLDRAKAGYERFLAVHGKKDVQAMKARLAVSELTESLKGLPPVPAAPSGPPAAGGFPSGVVLRLTFDSETLFDKRGLTNARDLSGKGNDALLVGATPCEGKVGEAMRFTERAYANCGSSASLRVGAQLSLVAWVQPSEGPASPHVLAKGGAYQWNWSQAPGKLLPPGLAGALGEVRLKKLLPYRQWSHLAVTYDRGAPADRLRLYLNGQLAATAAGKAAAPADEGPLYLATLDPQGVGGYFQGALDELAVFNRALSPAEIRWLYRARKAPPVTVAVTPVTPVAPAAPPAPAVAAGDGTVTAELDKYLEEAVNQRRHGRGWSLGAETTIPTLNTAKGGLLTGVKITVTTTGAGEEKVTAIQPLFTYSNGQTQGTVWGAPGGKVVILQARKGYAIGGLVGTGDRKLNGLQVEFCRIGPTGMIRHDNYLSEWVGGDRLVKGRRKVTTENRYPVGLCVYGDKSLDGLGLVSVGKDTPPLAGTDPSGQDWQHLIPLVQIARDAKAGSWQVKGETLTVAPGSRSATIQMPKTTADSFELSFKFTRVVGASALMVRVPAGEGRKFWISLGDTGSGSCSLMLKERNPQPDQTSTLRDLVVNKRENQVLVRTALLQGGVADVTVTLNGQRVLAWQGKRTLLQQGTGLAGILFSVTGTGMQIRDVLLRPVPPTPVKP